MADGIKEDPEMLGFDISLKPYDTNSRLFTRARQAGGLVLLSTVYCLLSTLLSTPALAQDAAQAPVVDPAADAAVADASDPAASDIDLSSADVKRIEGALKDRGYLSGPADGRRSERLREALRKFQHDEGL